MPTGPKGEKRPADAVKVMRIATGEETDELPDDGKDPAAKALGKKCGEARAAKMTPDRNFKLRHYLRASCFDGSTPTASAIIGRDGERSALTGRERHVPGAARAHRGVFEPPRTGACGGTLAIRVGTQPQHGLKPGLSPEQGNHAAA